MSGANLFERMSRIARANALRSFVEPPKARPEPKRAEPHRQSPELVGKFYWPSEDFSGPADNLCWHQPASPDADHRCVRPLGHPGKHWHEYSPLIRDYSHKDPRP